jgi:O-antigen/teichoic acid export membrane protein
MARFDAPARRSLIGGLYREQRRLLPVAAAIAAMMVAVLCITGSLPWQMGLLVLAGTAAALASLYREFFRMVLLGYRRPMDVFRADSVYVCLLIAGAICATLVPEAATIAAVTLAIAAIVGGLLLARALWRHEAWDIEGARGILLEIAPLATWSASGAVIHWTFSQGYNYLVAGTLSVAAVAAVAGTRLMMMPINLLSTGISTLMLPTTAGWLQHHKPKRVFRRLVLFAIGVALLSMIYLAVMWLLRDWIFTRVLHKQFEQRDLLLKLWSVVFVLMVCRDQMIHLLVARGRFHTLASLTLAGAVVSLTVSYLCMLRFGVVGALIGVLVGELINVVGIAGLSYRETRRDGAVRVS